MLLLLLTGCSAKPGGTIIQRCRSSPCATSTAGTVSGDVLGVRPFADTWHNIHHFLAFDYNIADPAAIAKHYDFVWGAEIGHGAAWRSANPSIFLTYYIPFHRDNGTFSNSNAHHDLAYWQAVHPDWVLYKCDRVTPAYEFGDPNMPLDFANRALISWQIQTYAQPASASGYDGIAADNVNLENLFGACGVYIHGQWVQRYTGQINDPRWRADVITWLTRMQQALHSLQHPLALIPNLDLGNLAPSDAQAQHIVSHLDGVLDEEGFTHDGDGYLTGSDWMQRIQFMESVQEQHKAYYTTNQFPSVGHAQIQWALASYLMGREHTAALYISTIQGYGADAWYNEYNVQIGSPSGPMHQTQQVYMRNYSHGLSIVNSSAMNSYPVTLPAKVRYSDLYGNPVGQTITMPPHSGLVLLAGS